MGRRSLHVQAMFGEVCALDPTLVGEVRRLVVHVWGGNSGEMMLKVDLGGRENWLEVRYAGGGGENGPEVRGVAQHLAGSGLAGLGFERTSVPADHLMPNFASTA